MRPLHIAVAAERAKLPPCVVPGSSWRSSSCPGQPGSCTRSSGLGSSSSCSATRPRPSRRSSPGSSAGWRSAASSAAASPTGSARRSGCTARSSSSSSSSSLAHPDHVPPPPRALPWRVRRASRPRPGAIALLRFGLALLALAPATVLMGATLPTLTRQLTRDAHLSSAFGRLYAANTLGAIIGTFAAGLILIELLGLTGTLVVGAACSGIAGLAALWLSREAEAAARARQPGATSGRGRDPGREAVDRIDPPPDPRARRGVRLGAHVARLPGPLDAPPVVRHRQLDLRLHDDPGHVPDRHRDRRRRVRRRSVPASAARSVRSRSPRSSSPRSRSRASSSSSATPAPLDPSRVLESAWAIVGPVLLVVLPTTIVIGLHVPGVVDAPRRRPEEDRLERRQAPRREHDRRDRRHVRDPVRRDPARRVADGGRGPRGDQRR